MDVTAAVPGPEQYYPAEVDCVLDVVAALGPQDVTLIGTLWIVDAAQPG